ncbi:MULTISPECIES: LamG-like jellyroll fold domain-containing protein [Nostocales]|uniref:LamG-like jellyroll fold domain-containing protein n=1 Tax=Nostocales TaxID=1161 RepID=UPI0006AC2A16|nr:MULTISPECIES: LamG-like jellyroll fold domain-containing protein [Nostocales]ALB39925.1 hypothetical protein AA650_05105 [Anabaena sp. WA102]MBO1063755.1 hypothetical protein [Anabaena sp. 54]MCX5983943.1 FG-GAP-like repeat-containing protein [Nostocales cyanobacterium LacPavin_0920_SED1_MAG_38_18]
MFTYLGSPTLNNPGLVAGSTGVKFDGVNDGIAIPDHNNINLLATTARSIELWFKADDLTGKQVIYEEGGTGSGLNIYLDGDQLKLSAWSGNAGEWLATQVVKDNKYHVVLSFDQGNLTGYLNGASFGTVTTNFTSIPVHSEDIGIGYMKQDTRLSDTVRLTGDGNYFNGVIDEVALYNVGLSPERAIANYASGFTQGLKVETFNNINLAGDHPQGLKTIVDQSSNHNNGYFRGVVSPDQSQVNSWSSKLVAYKNDYSSVFTPTTQSGTNTIDLVAGKLYKVELDAQSLNGVSTPQLQWNYTGVSNQIIPTSALFTDAQVETDWKVSGGKIGTSFLNTDADGALEFFNTTGDRYAISQPYDLSQGGNLSFSLILGGNSTINNVSGVQSVANGSTNGDTVDDNKAIKLEYSIDNGNTWVLLDSFTSKSEGGNWHNVVIDLPTKAQTQSTRFKWSQPSYVLDNWAIDNVGVVTNSNNVWADIKGADVLKAQKDNGTTIGNGEALYFTGKPFAIVTPLPDVSLSLLKDSFANLITGDFNGDGKTDFLRQQKFQWSYDNQLVTTYLSQGDGTFNTVNTNYPSSVANDFSAIIQTGDFNGDPYQDSLRSDPGVNIITGYCRRLQRRWCR